MKTVIQGEARLARLGDANPNALKEHKLLQNAKAKKDSLSEWSRRIYEGARYLDKLGRNVVSAQRELRELQEQRNALNGIRGLFRGADKREIDARILEQKSVLETAEHERNEFRNKLQHAESRQRFTGREKIPRPVKRFLNEKICRFDLLTVQVNEVNRC
ncbi:hypothetical protein OHD40_00010 [Escherichia coli]|nr:hypothetical protein [Escherichia coli]